MAAPLSLARGEVSPALAAFASDVGGVDAGPVTCVGGRTQWSVGGAVDASAREVRAPAGIVSHVPDELIVRVLAGTTVTDVDAALADHGQCVALPDWPGATVGGVLAVGHSGARRLGWGPVRDTVLEARYVSAEGRVVKAGGPVVKNVTGFDLCRLLVGSLGTLGFVGEVVLRCRPRPVSSRWFSGVGDPFALRRALFRPSSILWDGTTTWVLLEGHPADVDAEAAGVLGPSFAEVSGPPPLPSGRRSMAPSALRSLTGTFVAEVGVGVVHTDLAVPQAVAGDPLHGEVKRRFDSTGRLNPGRRP